MNRMSERGSALYPGNIGKTSHEESVKLKKTRKEIGALFRWFPASPFFFSSFPLFLVKEYDEPSIELGDLGRDALHCERA